LTVDSSSLCAFEGLAGWRTQSQHSVNLPKNETIAQLINYTFQLKKDGRAETTIQTTGTRLTRIAKICNLDDPEDVKATLASLPWKNNTKNQVANLYTGFLKYLGKTWKQPQYQVEEKQPFIPTEQELDTLISAGSPKTAIFLQILKETGARSGEAQRLKWIDIDIQRKTINITASKGSNGRILPITNELINMLNNIPRPNQNLFQVDLHTLRNTFHMLRKRTAKKLSNPRLLAIHLHTFRHWKGTMEYHKTKDIIHVKTVLGHKDIESTMIYINLEQAIFLSTSDEWTSLVTHNIQEETNAIDIGFELVRAINETNAIYRKRK
jgi:integrase